MVVVVLTMVVATSFYTFFRSNFFAYLDLQKDASNLTELAAKSHRIGNVLRGLTDTDKIDTAIITDSTAGVRKPCSP